MATKYLARTAIEGGRAGSNKWERRYSHKEERADQRAALSKVKDADDWDDAAPIIERRHVGKDFRDKLSPVYKFLDSKVGKSWKKVYAEIREKFDSRTTAGRHILFDHLLRDVDGSGQQVSMFFGFRYRDYYIDKLGILRKDPGSRRGHKRMDNKPKPKVKKIGPVDGPKLCTWLAGRKICRRSSKLFWSLPPDHCVTVWLGHRYNARYNNENCLAWYRTDPKGKLIVEVTVEHFVEGYGGKPHFRNREELPTLISSHGWRKAQPLSEKDLDYFDDLPSNVQEMILVV